MARILASLFAKFRKPEDTVVSARLEGLARAGSNRRPRRAVSPFRYTAPREA